MPYRNYSLVANAQFRNRSFDDLVKPLQMYTQEYNALEDAVGDLQTKASVWEGMANEQNDPIAYAQYKRYADDLQRQASQLVQNGLTPNSRRDLMNLKRRYASEILPIEEAYANRKNQAEEQRKAMLQNPTLLLSRRADQTSLDDYIRNPELGYEQYNGALLTEQVGQAASALAKSLRDYGNGKRLDDYTKTWLQQHGYTAAEVAQAINNPDSPRSNQILRTLVNNVMSDSGIAQWADRATLQQAYDYANQGLWQAVGETTVAPYTDEGAVLGAKAAQAKAQEPKFSINPVPIFTREEMDEYGKAINDYSDYFTIDNQGNFVLNDKGIEAYNKTSNRIGGTPYQTPEGVTVLTGVYPTETPSAFKTFMDKLAGDNLSSENLSKKAGEAWTKYLQEREGTQYDATRRTMYDFQLTDGQTQDEAKAIIQTALAGGLDLFKADFDKDTSSFKNTKDRLDSKDFKDMTILDIPISLYGDVAYIRDNKTGKVELYNLPVIAPKIRNMRNMYLDKAREIEQNIQEAEQNGGYYTDKKTGRKVYVDYEKLAAMQGMYRNHLQSAMQLHSQMYSTYKPGENTFDIVDF